MQTFNQHFDRAIRQFEHLQHGCNTARVVQILRIRIVFSGGLLGDQQDVLTTFHRYFQRLDGLGAPDKKWDHHVWEYHYIAQRQQRICQRAVAGFSIKVRFRHSGLSYHRANRAQSVRLMEQRRLRLLCWVRCKSVKDGR